MTVNYKKELESAAKNMILVHEPDILTRMIVRTITQKVMVSHAGVLLHDTERNTYIFTVSRGPSGLKIPTGFARMDSDNPLIDFFSQHLNERLSFNGALIYDDALDFLKHNPDIAFAKLLERALYQMEIYEAVLCIPSYFRNQLMGMLLLGHKSGKTDFSAEEIDFFTALASDVAMAIRNAQLFKDLQMELQKKNNLFINTTIALAAAIDAKDHYTRGHTARVTNLSLDIARRLVHNSKKSIDDKFLEDLHIASLLHDIGKIGISEKILNKIGPLSHAERAKIKEHPVIGVTILQPIRELHQAILGVKYHHENFDGSGYPDGLKGDQIPLVASIIAVADTFDAMTTDRPYRRRLSKAKAIEEIKRVSGKQHNPQISSILLELCQEGII